MTNILEILGLLPPIQLFDVICQLPINHHLNCSQCRKFTNSYKISIFMLYFISTSVSSSAPQYSSVQLNVMVKDSPVNERDSRSANATVYIDINPYVGGNDQVCKGDG